MTADTAKSRPPVDSKWPQMPTRFWGPEKIPGPARTPQVQNIANNSSPSITKRRSDLRKRRFLGREV